MSWKRERESIRHRIVMSFAPRSSSSPPPASATTRSARAWIRRAKSSASGAIASFKTASRASMRSRAAGVQPAFPPNVVVEVKRIACERPMDAGVPLARWSLPELHREVLARGLVATISGTTLWRWLDADAIRPWRHRSWVFPRDPQFAERAGPVLDLYAGSGRAARWARTITSCPPTRRPASRLGTAATRRRPSLPGAPLRVEHEYERRGAWAYLAAWDVHHARLFGRCEAQNGIAAFDRLVEQVMTQEPYRSARRVFWIMDNGSAHRGAKGDARLQQRWRQSDPGPHAPACELAQPDRDLLLDRAAQGPHAERLRQLGGARTLSARVSSTLPSDRDAVPLDLYASGFASAADPACRHRRHGAAGRMTVQNTSP